MQKRLGLGRGVEAESNCQRRQAFGARSRTGTEADFESKISIEAVSDKAWADAMASMLSAIKD